MMKKIIYLAFLFVICYFPINVNAHNLCSSSRYSKYKSEAYKVELHYEFMDQEDEKYFYIIADNVSQNVLLKYNDTYYEPTKDGDSIKIQNKFAGGQDYEVQIYGGYDTPCVEEYLYTKKISIPKYNKYSERDECIEYEEFKLCQKWYKGEIPSDEYFTEELNKYIESLKPNEEEKKEEVKEKNIFEKIIDFYLDNIVVTLTVTIIIVLLIIYKVVVSIIRRKKRIKLDQ